MQRCSVPGAHQPTLPKKRTVATPSLGSSPMRLQASIAPYISCRPRPAPQASSRAESASTFSHSYCRQCGHSMWGSHCRPGSKLRPCKPPASKVLFLHTSVLPSPVFVQRAPHTPAAGRGWGQNVHCVLCCNGLRQSISAGPVQQKMELLQASKITRGTYATAVHLTVLRGCASCALASVWSKQDFCGHHPDRYSADSYT